MLKFNFNYPNIFLIQLYSIYNTIINIKLNFNFFFQRIKFINTLTHIIIKIIY